MSASAMRVMTALALAGGVLLLPAAAEWGNPGAGGTGRGALAHDPGTAPPGDAVAMHATAAGGSDCCVANGTPGCDDPVCEAMICAVDPFCCDTKWDDICANQAVIECVETCGDPAGFGGDICAEALEIFGEGTYLFINATSGQDGVGDPACLAFGSDQIDHDVWFCWTSECSGLVTLETCGLFGIDIKIAVYDGCACPAGNGILACNDDACGLGSSVSWTAAEGSSYLLRIGASPGTGGDSGEFTIECVAGESICAQPPEHCQALVTQNASQSNTNNFTSADNFIPIEDGAIESLCWWGAYLPEPTGDTFVVTYYDAGVNGVPGTIIGGPFSQADGTLLVSGPVDTGQIVANTAPIWEYTGAHAPVAVEGDHCYWIEIHNDTDTPSTNWFWSWSDAGNSGVIIDGVPPNGYDLADEQPGHDFAFCLDVQLGPPFGCFIQEPHGTCNEAELIEGEGTFAFNNASADTDGFPDPLCSFSGSDQIDNDIWYCWTAPCTGPVLLETCGLTGVDTKIAVYDGCACPAGTGILACNDDACGLQSNLLFDAVAGNQYLLRIGTFPGAEGGLGQFSLQCATAPENDDCAAAIAIGVGTATEGSTTLASLDPGAPECGTTVTAPGVWYSVTGTGTMLIAGFCPQPASDCCIENGTPVCSDPECEAAVCTVDAFCCDVEWDSICADLAFSLCEVCGGDGAGHADYDTKLHVYCGACDDLTCVAGNDDTCGLRSEVSWCAAAGTTYYLLVDGSGGETGHFLLTVIDDGAACTPDDDCPLDVITGACCFDDGTCAELEADSCAAEGGAYQGDGSLCVETDCPSCDAPPMVECGVVPWNGGGPGEWVVSWIATSETDCGDVQVSAHIDIGCEAVPVENGTVFKLSCTPNGNPVAACFHHIIGGPWQVLHLVTRQHAVLRVTATDALGNLTICEHALCGGAAGRNQEPGPQEALQAEVQR